MSAASAEETRDAIRANLCPHGKVRDQLTAGSCGATYAECQCVGGVQDRLSLADGYVADWIGGSLGNQPFLFQASIDFRWTFTTVTGFKITVEAPKR